MSPWCQSSFPTLATCCSRLESTRGLSLFKPASQKLQKNFCTDKILPSLWCSPGCPTVPVLMAAQPSPLHPSGGPTPSNPFVASLSVPPRTKTCPSKTCRSFGLSDKPTSSVEDTKHKPVLPQGIPPTVQNMLVQQSRTSTFL